MPRLTRRSLFAAGLAAGAFARFPAIAQTPGLSHGMFTHAVASGDPTADAVILWTRFVTADARDGEIAWEIAEDESFARTIGGGRVAVRAAADFCIKVDAKGLQPGRPYAYRFVAASGPSVTGLTRTAPAGGVQQMTFALFSCSNLGFGYFHAYRDAATRADLDLCIHVGDYIYEYARGVYPKPEATVPGRLIAPETEIVTASDYHRRYASYRDDPDLQELHRVKPWITVWDDHELANDTYDGGAENHDPATQGAWSERLAQAVQAYLDWMPIRHDPAAGLEIQRRYDWGDLATILALDTRMIGRSLQLSYRTAFADVMDKGDSALAVAAEAFAKGPLAAPDRTLLGARQEAWLSGELKRSQQAGAVWQVLAQQVVAGNQVFPEAYGGFAPATATDEQRKNLDFRVRLGRLGLPWNLDSWGGYPAARARLLADCTANARNALVLSGDSHNAWASNLGGTADRPQALEIAGTGVSSPGLERSLSAAPEGGREAAAVEANPELAWCDVTRKGYALVTLTRERAETRFVATGPVTEANAPRFGETLIAAEASERGPGAWRRA
jgi:alkaline phosphatase D